MKRTIYFNEDNHHFYGKHPPEDMSVEGIQKLVDYYAEGTQVAGILFCTNVQRALFDSKVWECFWDDYDPELGENQPALNRLHGVKNHLLLRERGLDQHAIWLERCKHHGIEGWLTMRMNDCHGLEETFLHMQGKECNIGEAGWTIEWPTKFWLENPQLRRAPYRLERSWEGAFDYGKAEVREHHLKLVREIFERYDMFGFELDWMRWGMHFAPGFEQQGMPLLTQFIDDVRRIADEAEKRVGHPIKLAHRLPANPESCMALGFDPITWSKKGLVDMVSLSSFCNGSDFDYTIAIWRAMLGKNIKINTLVDQVSHPFPEERMEEYELLYGSAASALQRGADGVYLFNQNYRETDEPELLSHVLRHIGSEETLAECQRRHAITYPQVNAPGGPIRNILPILLRQPKEGSNFGRMEENITLRINIGTKSKFKKAVLCLGFSGISEEIGDNLEVRLNTKIITACEEPKYESISKTIGECPQHGLKTDFIDEVCFFGLPVESLFDGDNVIEIMPPQVDGQLVWAEIIII